MADKTYRGHHLLIRTRLSENILRNKIFLMKPHCLAECKLAVVKYEYCDGFVRARWKNS